MDTFLRPGASIKRSLLVNSIEKPIVTGVCSSTKLSETDTEIRLDAYCKYFKSQFVAQANFRIDLKMYDEVRKVYEDKIKKYKPTFDKTKMLFLNYLEKLVLQDTFVKCSTNKVFDTDIICYSNVLIKLMMVRGDTQQSFSLHCTKYKGNIYINTGRMAHGKGMNALKATAHHALFSDSPSTDINTNDPFVTNFHCVFNWKLCDTNLMYFAGVDGVDSDVEIVSTDLDKIKISRIKTRFLQRLNEKTFASHRSPFWWCQSFVLGIDTFHAIDINEDDVIERIETIDLDNFLHENEKHWNKSSEQRLAFLRLMMDLIKLRMTFVNCPLTVYEFDFTPKQQRTIHYKIHSGRNKLTFLTDQYIDAIKDL